MLVFSKFIENECFAQYDMTVIPEEEFCAANCIWVNGTVIVPEGFPAVKAAVESLGYPVLLVAPSELRRIDSG